MIAETDGVDSVVQTTADVQKEQAVDEVLSSGGVDVSAEANVSPDDILERATPKARAEAQETPQDEVVAEEVQEPVDEVKPEDGEALGKRATKRVQDAVNRAKDAEVRLAEMQEQSRQQISYLQYQLQQQMAQQQQAVQRQEEFYRRQQAMYEQAKLQEEEKQLSPAQRIEREWLEKAKQALAPELQQLKSQLAQEQQLRTRAMQAAQERQMLQAYKQKADLVNRTVLFKEMDEKDLSTLNDKAQELLLTWGTAAGEEPEQAVVGLKKFLDDYYQARLRATAKSGAKLKQATSTKTVPNTPSAPPTKIQAGKVFKFDRSSNKWGYF